MEIILEQRFIKREQRNDSTDNVGNVVRPVENRTFRTKCGPLGQNATSTGQVFPVKSWSISYALPNLQTHTETSTRTHKQARLKAIKFTITETTVHWARHPKLHSSNHIRQLYNMSHVLKYVFKPLQKSVGTACLNPVTSGSRHLCSLIKLLAN